MSDKKESSQLLTPISILIAGAFIAGAVYLSGGVGNTDTMVENDDTGNEQAAVSIREVTKDDYILGNPDAKIKLVEFSDMDCPFCGRFHITMKQLMAEYGEGGDVAWVYRHLPLTSLHPNARKKAEAGECVGELGGNTAFWKFLDDIFENSGNGDLTLLTDYAVNAGVDGDEFDECLASGKTASAVEEDEKDAFNAGARGTPYSLIVMDGTPPRAVPGALPIDTLRSIIDSLIESE